MSQYPPAHVSFKARLRLAMQQEDVTVYGLARRLDPDNPERAERNLFRWLSPESTILPSRENRLALAGALGKDAEFFSPIPEAQAVSELAVFQLTVERMTERVNRQAWALHDGEFLVSA